MTTYLIRCRGGDLTAALHDRFHSLRDDGTRRIVPAAELTTADCLAGKGRVLSVTPLAAVRDAEVAA